MRIYFTKYMELDENQEPFLEVETKTLPDLDCQVFAEAFYKYCRDNKLSDFVLESVHEGLLKNMQQALALEAIRDLIKVK